MTRMRRRLKSEPKVPMSLLDEVASMAYPLNTSDDIDPLIQHTDGRRYVLLGEATHGTSDFYRWRTKISQRLITEKSFSFIAVEGDWPDCYRVNRYVKGYPNSGSNARSVLQCFGRWPTWMWANAEVVELIEWLRLHNESLPSHRKVGFYGLDVYSLWESMDAIYTHVRERHPEALPDLLRVVNCFQPYGEDAVGYARATQFFSETCEGEVVQLLGSLRARRGDETFDGDGDDAHFVAEQNAHVLKNAEAYYRSMVHAGPESWNLRDAHMMDTLDRLMVQHGGEGQAKAIVWEHNTHIGDARFTDMAAGGEFNVGQLVRERHGEENVALVGFASYTGTVIAGREWDGPEEVMRVPPARDGSWEDVLHRARGENGLWLFQKGEAGAASDMMTERGHRAIGVVYKPEFEHLGNFVPTVLPRRYDALLFIDRSVALHPLGVRADLSQEPPETYPSTM